MNGDAFPDVVALREESTNNVMVFINERGSELTQLSPSPYSITGTPSHGTVGDFDADGKLDFATASSISDDVTIRLNRADPPTAVDGDNNSVPDACQTNCEGIYARVPMRTRSWIGC